MERICRLFQKRNPQLVKLLQEAETDVFAFYSFPADHRRQIWSTNSLERLNKEVSRHFAPERTRNALFTVTSSLAAELSKGIVTAGSCDLPSGPDAGRRQYSASTRQANTDCADRGPAGDPDHELGCLVCGVKCQITALGALIARPAEEAHQAPPVGLLSIRRSSAYPVSSAKPGLSP